MSYFALNILAGATFTVGGNCTSWRSVVIIFELPSHFLNKKVI